MLVAVGSDAGAATCLASLRAHTPDLSAVSVDRTASAVNAAMAEASRADVVLLSAPCRVGAEWLAQLAAAARADTNTATASALVDREGPLAIPVAAEAELASPSGLDERAELVGRASARLRPRINRIAGPCVYLRRDALELVGGLDDALELDLALEVDFALRCLSSGLAHVVADDVVVGRLRPAPKMPVELPPSLLRRYPYLERPLPVDASDMLRPALHASVVSNERVSVTLDARTLGGPLTGTNVNTIELVRALARSGELDLRVLVSQARLERETRELVSALPSVVLLDEDQVDPTTPSTAVFHRPVQMFAAEDVELATRLGERVVVSQLDLIAYRNPTYFPDLVAWENYRRASRLGMLVAERTVVFSQHTREELSAEGLLERERIAVIPPGLDHERPSRSTIPTQLQPPGPEPFLLCLGTDLRHKNRVFALRLLDVLRAQHDWPGTLVLAGTHIADGSSAALEQEYLDAHDTLREAVQDIGAVSDGEKQWLIEHARAVVYPSTYEGFGLVPFEAALHGVPCVFAARASLAEVAPVEAAAIVPWSEQESADGVLALLEDDGARSRHVDLLARGARGLTWKASAEALIDVYRQAAQAPPRPAAMRGREAIVRELELRATHQADIDSLISEREIVAGEHSALLAELGPGRGLVGAHGALPEDLQHALLALSARSSLARPLYGLLARLFAAARALRRAL